MNLLQWPDGVGAYAFSVLEELVIRLFTIRPGIEESAGDAIFYFSWRGVDVCFFNGHPGGVQFFVMEDNVKGQPMVAMFDYGHDGDEDWSMIVERIEARIISIEQTAKNNATGLGNGWYRLGK